MHLPRRRGRPRTDPMPRPRFHSYRLALAVTLPMIGCAGRDRGTRVPDRPTPKRELKLDQQGYMKEFDNGLVLFVLPDPYTRLVEFDVRQQVGSRDDPAGKSGMAHFVEHLMFELPADGVGSAKIMSDLPRHALFFNAYTSADETHYMHTGKSDEIETYMKYTATRLAYDCEAIDDATFLREREVVRNEHRWRGESAEAQVYFKMIETIYPKDHPYHVAFLDPELTSITRDDACKFIREFYTPGTASVVITGDVDPEQVAELAKKYLAPLPARTAKPRQEVPPITLAERHVRLDAPVRKPSAMVLFAMPRRFDPDRVAALAGIETMFLAISVHSSLRGTDSYIDDLQFVQFGGKEAELMGLYVTTKETANLQRAIDEAFDGITRGFAPKLEKHEERGTYDSVRQRARLRIVDGMSTVSARAAELADYLEEGDNPGFFGAELAKLDALTPERAQQVGRKLFARERAMVVEIRPDKRKQGAQSERAGFAYRPESEEEVALPQDIDPAEAHAPLSVVDIAPPEGQSLELTLDSGMRVVLVQSTDVPVMDMQLIVGAGRLDTSSQPDIADLAATQFGAGDTLEGRNLMQFFDLAGGLYFPRAAARASTFATRGLSIYLDFLVAGLSEQVVQAEYRTGALENWKEARRKQLKKKSGMQQARRHNLFFTALYGKGHPHVQEQIADGKELRDIKYKDLEAFRNRYYRAGNSALVMTGGFDMGLAVKYVEAYFGKPVLRSTDAHWLEPRADAARKPAPPPNPGDIRVITEADAERAQTDVTIAYPLTEVYGDDHAALLVAAEMFNTTVAKVREQLGASYGVYARVDAEQPRLEIGGALDSKRAGEALVAIRRAIEALPAGDDYDRLFAHARRKVLGRLIDAQGDPRLLAAQLAEAVRAGRGYAYFEELASAVATLTPGRVRAQIDRVVKKDRSVTLIQGPKAGIQDALAGAAISNATALPDVVHDEADD